MSEVRLPGCIKIGHADNGHNGVTAILCPKGCMGGVDVRGGGPGTRETDLLRPEKAAESVNAIVLTGGSAYGLESACGVMKWLSERGYGFKVSGKVVPIVPAAVIFSRIPARRRSSSGSERASIWAARMAALSAPSTATQATGMPLGICTMDSRESSPPIMEVLTGTPMTGRVV